MSMIVSLRSPTFIVHFRDPGGHYTSMQRAAKFGRHVLAEAHGRGFSFSAFRVLIRALLVQIEVRKILRCPIGRTTDYGGSDMNVTVRTNDRFVTVAGRKIRYLEEGSGAPAILLHGASLGSSADVFRRNLRVLGANGIRAIAFDLPGYGKSDRAEEQTASYRKKFIIGLMDALKIERAALIAHSASGNMGLSVAMDHPDRISHFAVLGTGSLLPPIENAEGGKIGGREAAVQSRLEDRMVRKEPTLADTRALLEANLFHHELITDEELALRHENSIGVPFEEFCARHAAGEQGNKAKKAEGKPLYQRLVDLKMPLLLIYGRNDRARAEERAKMLKETYPQLDLHFAEGCKHLVPWDAADLVHKLTIPFITGKEMA
jgi:pimeloyl-ACP methyl ester carboxylesterase